MYTHWEWSHIVLGAEAPQRDNVTSRQAHRCSNALILQFVGEKLTFQNFLWAIFHRSLLQYFSPFYINSPLWNTVKPRIFLYCCNDLILPNKVVNRREGYDVLRHFVPSDDLGISNLNEAYIQEIIKSIMTCFLQKRWTVGAGMHMNSLSLGADSTQWNVEKLSRLENRNTFYYLLWGVIEKSYVFSESFQPDLTSNSCTVQLHANEKQNFIRVERHSRCLISWDQKGELKDSLWVAGAMMQPRTDGVWWVFRHFAASCSSSLGLVLEWLHLGQTAGYHVLTATTSVSHVFKGVRQGRITCLGLEQEAAICQQH